MSEKLKEFTDIPQEFVRDGRQVRTTHQALPWPNLMFPFLVPYPLHEAITERYSSNLNVHVDLMSDNVMTEFLQICKAVAIGFAVMGFIGYFVKLIHIPMYVTPMRAFRKRAHYLHSNNILVYVTKLHDRRMVLMLLSAVVHSDVLAFSLSIGSLGQVWVIVCCCSLFYYYTPLTVIPLAVRDQPQPEVHIWRNTFQSGIRYIATTVVKSVKTIVYTSETTLTR